MRCPVHLSIGQEAVAVGVCTHLSKKDWVMSAHRSHAHYLAKGGDLKAMFAELYGKATGCTGGRGGSMHLVDLRAGFLGAVPIVGSTIPIAVGAAWGARMQGRERVVVAFFGEAATEEGAFHEALNFAQLKRLPVVFVCENNFYSVYSPLSVRQPAGREIFELAKGHGVESRQGDGNDLLAVLGLARWAIDQARRGQGPIFLEFKTYRWREHCGPNYDNDLGYRSEAEFFYWKKKCPVEHFERVLKERHIFGETEIQAIQEAIAAEIDDAVEFGKRSPFPDASDLGTFTYAE
jgi:pyruvate dehydrogenase E1 component alpha subunit